MQIDVQVWLDCEGGSKINIGVGFFDYMLDQIVIYGGFCMEINVKGDFYIDDYYIVEDIGLVLGEVLKIVFGDKCGICCFGFVLLMDECFVCCVLDIFGCLYLEYKVEFIYQCVGDFSIEMIEYFFCLFLYIMGVMLYLKIKGKNDYYCVESLFKVFGCILCQVICVEGDILFLLKGVL